MNGSIPTSTFGARTTAQDIVGGMNLDGKVALVTGCNSGIGLETMRALVASGAHVIGTGRSIEKATTACASVGGRTTAIELDLSDFESVVRGAGQVTAMNLPIDMLICNAGIIGPGRLEMIDGIEKTFSVNHLGHFVLVHRLLPSVSAAKAGRIVHVSSMAALRGARDGINFDILRGTGQYSVFGAYGVSKLANALFSRQLAKRLQDSNVTSNALHPGFVRTNLGREVPVVMRFVFKAMARLLAKNTQQGAATTCYVAASPMLDGVSGEFFSDCNPLVTRNKYHIENDDMAEELWKMSEEMTANYLT